MLPLPQRLQNQQVSLVFWTYLDSKSLSQTHLSSYVSILLTRLCNSSLINLCSLEQNIYEREGIDWSFIDFPDNADCIALIERSRTGIIAILDETCIFPKGDDPMFARKLYQKCTDSSCFSASKRQVVDNRFAITHYAGLHI